MGRPSEVSDGHPADVCVTPPGRKTMLRKLAITAGLLAFVGALGGCFSLNGEENTRIINKWGRDADSVRALTNKYFFNYDRDDPRDW